LCYYHGANDQHANGNELPHLNENVHHHHVRGGDDGVRVHVHVNDHVRDDLHLLSDNVRHLSEAP
jgi:hypothetical protein